MLCVSNYYVTNVTMCLQSKLSNYQNLISNNISRHACCFGTQLLTKIKNNTIKTDNFACNLLTNLFSRYTYR